MPSFDIVSEIDKHELNNAIDQANRELTTRFDFKGVKAHFELKEKENIIQMLAQSDFQLKQMEEILKAKLAKRQLDGRFLTFEEIETNLSEARQTVKVKNGIDKDSAKRLVKLLKEANLKVQASIQGEQVRVTGKKRDDLQEAIAELKAKEKELALQFENFRD